MTNQEIIDQFILQALGDDNIYMADNLFYEDGVLYSYGYHWPIAVWHDTFCCVNTSRRSNTSSKHVALVIKSLTSSEFSEKLKMMEIKQFQELLRSLNKRFGE